MSRKYVISDGQIFISFDEVSAILTNLADNTMPGLDAEYALRSTANLFQKIEGDSLEMLNAPNTES